MLSDSKDRAPSVNLTKALSFDSGFILCISIKGTNHNIIVPPSWIVKLPGRENFKSSLRKSPRSKKDKGSTRRRNKSDEKPENPGVPKAFVVKPIPLYGSRPIIVFINPKSGGNQGAKLMQKFQWLLNPRQVFDLTQGGPKAGYYSSLVVAFDCAFLIALVSGSKCSAKCRTCGCWPAAATARPAGCSPCSIKSASLPRRLSASYPWELETIWPELSAGAE